MFSDKRLNVNGPKTLIKKVVSNDTIEPGSVNWSQR